MMNRPKNTPSFTFFGTGGRNASGNMGYDERIPL